MTLNTRLRLPMLLAALLAIGLLALPSLLPPPQAQAQQVTEAEVWSGTATVKDVSGTSFTGYGTQFPGSTLDDTTFDFGGTSYTVTAFNVATGGTLGFAISPVLSDRAKSLLRLDIGSTKLAFKDATLADFGPDDGNYSLLNWNTSLSWSDGDSVSLSITEVNAAAEGKPSVVVDGPGVFAADTSGITDENGLGALSYQWVSVDGGTDTDISGATGQTYPVTGSETGDSIKVRVTFTDQGGFTEGPFTSDSVMMLKPDEIWAAIMTVGSLGTGTGAEIGYGSGFGSLSDTTVSYDSTTYTVLVIRLVVDVPNSANDFKFQIDQTLQDKHRRSWIFVFDGSELAFSSLFGRATLLADNSDVDWSTGDKVRVAIKVGNFAATGKPTISGGAWVGATLTADASDISDEDGLGAFSYQWVRTESGTDTDISGAISSTYDPTAADVGKTLKVRVSFTDGRGHSESRTSDATEAVTARPPNSPATGKPTITGTLAVGQTLTADTTGIADANGLGSFTYQWGHSEGGTSTLIFGAERETYTLTEDDKGKYIKVQVTFFDGDGYKEVPASDAVGPVGAPLPPGMTISPLMLEIDEGRIKLYSVTLNAQPTANVTINISGHSGTDLSLSHTSLTFIPQAWNTPGVVKVNAAEDNDELDDMVTLIHTVAAGSAPEMSVAAVNLPVTINDNDKSNVVVPSRTTLTVGEGGSGSYTVKLSDEPTAGVTVQITGHSGTDVSVSPSNISFTTANWNTARTVQVSAADDHDSTNDSVTLAHTVAAGSAQEFTGAAAVNVAVTVTDNDTPGVAISKSALEIDEGASDRYTVRLNTQPPANVTITVGGHSGTGVSPSPASLTFTRANWSTTQTVTVSAAQDDDATDATVTLTHAVSGTGDYASVTAADVGVTVDDDDTPRVVVSPSPLRVDEGGSASYKVRLATLPTAGVTVTVSGHSGTVLSSVSPTTLTFTRSNWKTEQTVAVSAPEDGDSSNETVTLSHAASGSAAEYAGLSTDLRVNVFDNDAVHVPHPDYAPSDLVVYVVRDTSDQAVWGGWPFPIKESHLHWRDPDAAPQAWNNDADAGTDLHHKYRYNQGFGRYEVERRTRGTDWPGVTGRRWSCATTRPTGRIEAAGPTTPPRPRRNATLPQTTGPLR